MQQKISIISTLLMFGTIVTMGQQKPIVSDTTIKATTIEITQIYKPQIRQSPKENYNAILPPIDNTLPTFSYSVPKNIQTYSYKPMPLQPLAIAKDTAKKFYNHYLKAGLGNLSTVYIDAGLSDIKTKDYRTNIHFGLLNQKGEIVNQQQTIGVLNAEISGQSEKNTILFKLDASHHNFYQYGFDHIALPNQKANNQQLSGATLNFDLNSKDYDSQGLKKIISIGAAHYTGSNFDKESTIKGGVGLQKSLNENLYAQTSVEGVSTFFNANNYSVTNAFVSLKLGGIFQKNNILIKAFATPTLAQNQKKYLLSDLLFQVKFPKAQTKLSFGLQGTLQQNTYQQLFVFNPFLSQYTAQQSFNNELFFQAEKSFGHHLSFDLRVSIWQYSNFSTYVNDPIGRSERLLVTYIPKVNAISTIIGMRYQIGQTLSIGAHLSIFNYEKLANNGRVSYSPSTRLLGDLNWQLLPQLNFNAYAAVVSGNYAMDKALNPILLKSYVDMGFGFEYIALEKLSFFINFNNLLNSKYERWQGYQAYGINIYGGVRLKF